MEDKYRKSGIDTIGDIPWGTHMCQFYRTKDDLIETLVPYFKAGLENNEFCMWVTSEPLGVKEAEASLRKAVKNLDGYIEKDQIEILDYSEWYTKSGKFNAEEVLQGWVEKEREALGKGFNGLRATGNTSWLGADDWVAFIEYAVIVDSVIGEHWMIDICTYSLDRCESSEVLDVINNYEVTLIKRNGLWRTVESDERKRLKKVLTASEVRFRRLFETAQDGILILDTDTGQITDSNPFIKGLLGYTDEELLGKKIWEVGLFKDLAKSKDSFKKLQSEGYVRYEDLKLATKDGKSVDVEFISNVYDVDYKKIIQCNIREISKRKEAEEVSEQYKELLEELVKQRTNELAESNRKLLQELTERKKAEEQIKHLTLSLRAIRNVNQLIIKEKNHEKLLWEACRFLTSTNSYPNAWIALLDESGKLLVHAESGWGRDLLPMLEQLKLGDIPACGRQALEKMRLVVIDELASMCTGCPLQCTSKGKAVLTIRLEHSGEVYGLLNVSIPGVFTTDEEMGLFNEVAGDIAFALHNMALDTKRKELEDSIHESEEKYRDLYSNAPTAYVSVGTDSLIKESNKIAQQLFGYSEDELCAMPVFNLYAEESKSKAASVFERRFKQGLDVVNEEMVYQRKDGKKVCGLLSATLIKDKNGQVVASRSVVIDITERKEMEILLKESEEKWRSLVENAPNSIILVDRDKKIQFINHVVTGLAVESVIGKSIFDYIQPEYHETVRKVVDKVFQTGEIGIYEIMGTGPDGSTSWYETSTGPLKHGGQITGMIQIVSDVTERKQMQAQILINDRLALIGELISGVAHELNNPLTGVIGFSDLLVGRKGLPDDVKEDLIIINKEAQRTANIVKNLLTFARKQPKEKQLTDINKAIEAVIELRAYEQKVSNLEVNTRFASDLPEIISNAFDLQQVFLNIIVNAEHAMLEAHGKGTITITTVREGDIIRVSLADDGPGISEEHIGHVFDPFFTTKEVGRGTGLGLSICYGTITDHGGRIYVESKPGKGATFIIELPVVTTDNEGTKNENS